MEYERLDNPATDTTTLTITGELDALTVSALRPEADRIVADGPPHVVVDLAGVIKLDSAGAGFLTALFKRLRNEQRTMRVIHVRGEPLRIVYALRLEKIYVQVDEE